MSIKIFEGTVSNRNTALYYISKISIKFLECEYKFLKVKCVEYRLSLFLGANDKPNDCTSFSNLVKIRLDKFMAISSLFIEFF